MEGKTAEEDESKNGLTHTGHRFTSITEPGVFDSPFASDALPCYSMGPKFQKLKPHDWVLNLCVLLGLQNKARTQVCRSNSPFLQSV